MKTAKTSSSFSRGDHLISWLYGVPIIVLLCILIQACSSDEGAAPTGIQGSVMDEQGNPYPNVELTLQPGNISAVTNNTGDFSFNNLSPDSYEVSIDPPKSSEVPAGNSASVTLAGTSQTVNFTLRILPNEAALAYDSADPLGELRNGQGDLPTEPDELIFRNHSSGLFPIVAPDGHQLTFGEWSTAQGTATITCNGNTSNYELSFEGLVPNGIYTIWNNIFSSTKRIGSAIDDQIAGGALGASNGSENAFTASPTGTATLSFIVGGGDELGFGGQQPDCVLSDAAGMMLVLLYHIDNLTYGAEPGPPETIVNHLLFYY